MIVVEYLLLIAMFCLTPAVVIWLCGRFPLLDKLGPIMVLYAIGMVVGNLPFMPDTMKVLQEMIPNVAIPLAIPMMLFGCTFSKNEGRLQLKLILSGFSSVAIAVIIGYLLFGCKVTSGAEVGGIISGMYTGGTLNAAALQAIFRIENEIYVLVNSYDIIISFLYFIFLFSFGIRMFRRLYGEKTTKQLSQSDRVEIEGTIQDAKANPYSGMLSKAGLKSVGTTVGITLVVVALSAGVAVVMPQGWFMVVFILLLTTLGVAASFVKRVRELKYSYDMGMYLIYIFSLAIASMADFSNLNLAQGVNQMAFMTFAVFVSLAIHAIFCRLMRVDADSMVISSVAFINSPPFVPMVSVAMNNKKTLVTGLAAGVAGYALGNHFGYLMSELLQRL
ncbi:MAG: DUF819 family protein [Alistipes sp.]|nr:DUF819 family protein [Alistipes sp.]